MKRRSFTAAAAWAMSYARPLEWHLLGTAHSADLTRVRADSPTAVSMVAVNERNAPRFGFWDGWWVRSRSGRLTLVAHTIDYDGGLRGVDSSPPSLIVDLAGPGRARVVAFARMPDSASLVRRLGFAWDADAHDRDGVGGPVSVRARMLTVPYWFLVLAGLPLSLLWMTRRRATARTRKT
jgi:hypothetical protein